MTIGERIRKAREKCGYSQVELADKLNISKQSLYKYEYNMITNIPSDKIEAMSTILNCTPSYLMGWEDKEIRIDVEHQKSSNSTKRLMEYHKRFSVPVLGRVAAGIPYHMMEEILDYEEIDPKLAATGEYFALRIKGDSMEPRICNGDVVIVKVQSDAETGDTVIATVNGDDATCKRLKKYNDSIVLISNNPTYEPMVYDQKDIDEKPVTIIGKVVELRGKF